MADGLQAKSPGEELADRILDKLMTEGLVTLLRRDEVSRKLASGNARAVDWPVWIMTSPTESFTESANG